jgi:hypothetical protein
MNQRLRRCHAELITTVSRFACAHSMLLTQSLINGCQKPVDVDAHGPASCSSTFAAGMFDRCNGRVYGQSSAATWTNDRHSGWSTDDNVSFPCATLCCVDVIRTRVSKHKHTFNMRSEDKCAFCIIHNVRPA